MAQYRIYGERAHLTNCGQLWGHTSCNCGDTLLNSLISWPVIPNLITESVFGAAWPAG